MELKLGMLTEATDGPGGAIADIIVDPVTWRVTHLVVQPHHDHDQARLVPIAAVVSKDADHVVLSWTTGQIAAAPLIQVTDFVSYDVWPRIEGGWDVGSSRVLAWPYYPYAGLGTGFGYAYGYGNGYGWGGPARVSMTYDRVPTGMIEVRRASLVQSSDGHTVGHVDGFLVDLAGKVTHLLLDHGHLWAHREVTIPIDDIVRATSDLVELSVSRDVVGEYPSVPFRRHGA